MLNGVWYLNPLQHVQQCNVWKENSNSMNRNENLMPCDWSKLFMAECDWLRGNHMTKSCLASKTGFGNWLLYHMYSWWKFMAPKTPYHCLTGHKNVVSTCSRQMVFMVTGSVTSCTWKCKTLCLSRQVVPLQQSFKMGFTVLAWLRNKDFIVHVSVKYFTLSYHYTCYTRCILCELLRN